ncbi:MAG: alpha/beta hydrolase [Rhodopirellula sp.]|nr:alpha/beta hydrolase [Rhodopirellula sp.]
MRFAIRCLALVVVLLGTVSARAEVEVQITPDVVYGHKDGMALTFDRFRPKEANGAGVLFMVSGGWYSRWSPPEKFQGVIQTLLDRGFTVFAVRHGSSPKYLVPEAVADVRRAVRYIRCHAAELGIDPERLGVTGASAGGHLSLMLGTTGDDGETKKDDPLAAVSDRVKAVAPWCPPTDIRPWVDEKSSYYQNYPALRFNPEEADDCSPLLQVSADDAATLLIHGDKDELVPIDHSRKILAELEKHGVPAELLTLEGAGHGFRGDDVQRARDATAAWFEKHLGK